MGISTGGSKGGPKGDINVTPLVDIVLVLLIIFLVATPIKLRHVTLEVPRKLDEEVEDTTLASRQIVVLLHGDGKITLKDGSKESTVPRIFDLTEAVRPLLDAKKTEKVVFVDFEDAVLYGDVVTTMDLVKVAGAEKVALKTRDEKKDGE